MHTFNDPRCPKQTVKEGEMLAIRELFRGLWDLIESLWNEGRVLASGAPPDRVPTADELSYRN